MTNCLRLAEGGSPWGRQFAAEGAGLLLSVHCRRQAGELAGHADDASLRFGTGACTAERRVLVGILPARRQTAAAYVAVEDACACVVKFVLLPLLFTSRVQRASNSGHILLLAARALYSLISNVFFSCF